MPQPKITNARYHWMGGESVHGDIFIMARVTLSFDYEGNRYHVWLDKDTGNMEEQTKGPVSPYRHTLYKNPPSHLKYGDTGYFRTKHLDATAQANADLIYYASVMAGDFMVSRAAYKADIDAARAALQTKLATEQRLQAARLAGPALLAALERWQRFAHANGWTDADYHDADGTGWVSLTDAAIKQAKEGTSNA